MGDGVSLPHLRVVCSLAAQPYRMFKSRIRNRDVASSPPAFRPPRSRSIHHTLLFGLKRNRRAIARVMGVLLIVVLSAGLILLYTDLSWSMVTTWIDGVNPVAALPLMALLPI